ncbi:MAG: hypothetical protein ACXITV_10900 [Luteibaculaceae bacterium]
MDNKSNQLKLSFAAGVQFSLANSPIFSSFSFLSAEPTPLS